MGMYFREETEDSENREREGWRNKEEHTTTTDTLGLKGLFDAILSNLIWQEKWQ